MRRRDFIQTMVAGCCAGSAALGAVRGDEVMYIGGTMTSIPDKTEGALDLSGEKEGVFNSKKGSFRFQYAQITGLEYGQKAGRRLGLALAVNPVLLFSKKRKHFLTVEFTDEQGQRQGAVLEVAKGKVRGVITALEAKSGKQTEYESEEAKKHVN
jgi:hypothetical protein